MAWILVVVAVGLLLGWLRMRRPANRSSIAERPSTAEPPNTSGRCRVEDLKLTDELLAGVRQPVDVVYVSTRNGPGVAVAGVTYRRPALNRLMGNAQRWTGVGVLLPEPTNPHDRFAVQVIAEGEVIGYVPRKLAAQVHAALATQWRRGHAVVTHLTLFRAGRQGFGGRMELSGSPGFVNANQTDQR